MITCTRRFQFCAGHRVLNHESKCRNLHGHNYVVYVEARMWDMHAGPTVELDDLGRVVDFSVLKDQVGTWIDLHWDHGFIVYEKDSAVLDALHSIEGQKLFVLPFNPTAENMAKYLFNHVCPAVLQQTGVKAVRVVVEETENCSAMFAL